MGAEQMTIDGQSEPVHTGNMGALNCPDTVHVHVVSFGAGVQSTALAMLVANQDPRLLRALQMSNGALPEAFVFADTGDEKRETYEHLWKMCETLQARGFPLIVVRSNKARSLSEHVIEKARAQEGGMSTPPRSTYPHATAKTRCRCWGEAARTTSRRAPSTRGRSATPMSSAVTKAWWLSGVASRATKSRA